MCVLLCLASLAEQNVLCNLRLWKLDGLQLRAIMNITALDMIILFPIREYIIFLYKILHGKLTYNQFSW